MDSVVTISMYSEFFTEAHKHMLAIQFLLFLVFK